MSDLAGLVATGPTPYVAGGLAASGVAVAWSRRRELIKRWLTWSVTAPILGAAFWLGRPGVLVLAAALAVGCALEYSRLARLSRSDRIALLAGVLVSVGVTTLRPDLSGHLLWALPLASALPAVLEGDGRRGGTRAARVAFGVAWISALGGLVSLGHLAFPLVVAVSVGDVAAWCAGKALRGPLLSPLSPGKRWSGAVGAAVVGLTVLGLLGALTLGTAIAVAVAAPIGDLLESMLKREADVKDAGTWLPGFGGLLDRVDSLLVALAVAVVLS